MSVTSRFVERDQAKTIRRALDRSIDRWLRAAAGAERNGRLVEARRARETAAQLEAARLLIGGRRRRSS